ncbi:transposase, partial [Thiolapillus sp.]
PRSEAYFVFPLAQGTPGKQCGLAATGDYQPSLRSPWLAANDRICCMKPVLDTSPNPSAPASFPSADLLRILEEKDRSLEEKDRLLVQQQALLKEREALIAEQQKLLRLMEEQLRLARLRKFGARSEKLPFQGELFDEAELEVSLEDVEQALAEAEAEPKKPRKRRTKADGFD